MQRWFEGSSVLCQFLDDSLDFGHVRAMSAVKVSALPQQTLPHSRMWVQHLRPISEGYLTTCQRESALP